MKEKICLVTGGFDPLHRGHIEYFKAAKKSSKYLVVGLNSDDWLIRKKKYLFMPVNERRAIIENLKFVDAVIEFDDKDNSACDAIYECLKFSKKVIFANGGDRGKENTPELKQFSENQSVEFIYEIGGKEKINSSSWMVDDFINHYASSIKTDHFISTEKIIAPWGEHSAFIDEAGFKVKQLNVNPGGKLSLQKHEHRSEHWVVVRGQATVEIDSKISLVNSGEYVFIPLHSIHRLSNEHTEELIVIEVQCGKILEESDITRYEDYYGRES
ncbi:adenylyltransferase/cytidyltransferase family protein [Gammaproteobacteria bacterium]|jgi:cytidyltransferase-like protein|nr:adenylyltransferase/cytidyltransferase family protein [Gammaproteobacteria bacterium]